MKTLTLEHLAPYLPYGLKFYVFDDPSFEKKYLEKYPNGNSRVVITIDNLKDKVFKDGYKPILRPLSDLAKEIEHNGEKFVPMVEYNYLRFEEISNYKGGQNVLNFIQFREYKLLLEMHFDFFGLIEQGLAIDINTLNK